MNGGFEQPALPAGSASSTTSPYNWTTTQFVPVDTVSGYLAWSETGSGYTRVNVPWLSDLTAPADGSQFMFFTAGDSAMTGGIASATQMLTVEPSTWYTVNWWVMARFKGDTNGRIMGGNDMNTRVSFDNGVTWDTIYQDQFVTWYVWSERTATFFVPYNATSVLLKFETTGPLPNSCCGAHTTFLDNIYVGTADCGVCCSHLACDDNEVCTDDYCLAPGKGAPFSKCQNLDNGHMCGSPYPDNITYTGVIRDIRWSHTDFEEDSSKFNVGLTCGMLADDLDHDNIQSKPIYRGGWWPLPGLDPTGAYLSTMAGCDDAKQATKGKGAFDSWFWDEPLVNQRATIELVLTLMPPPAKPGTYIFRHDIIKGEWFPFSNYGWGNDITAGGNPPWVSDYGMVNFGFTTEVHARFQYRGNEYFVFAGDDDTWVFIDNKLAIDMGGEHPQKTKSLDLTLGGDAQQKLGLVIGQKYDMALFNAERHTSQSNLFFMSSVIPTNVAPVCYSDSYTLEWDEMLTNAPMRVVKAAGERFIESFGFSHTSLNGSVVTNSSDIHNRVFNFTHSHPGVYTIDFWACDWEPLCCNSSITITVLPEPPRPVAQSFAWRIPVNYLYQGMLYGSDPNARDLTYHWTSPPSNGTLSLQPLLASYNYTSPDCGTFTGTYYVYNGLYKSDLAKVTFEVVCDWPYSTTTVTKGLSEGALAGIIVGSVIGAAGIAAVAIFLLCFRSRMKGWEAEVEAEFAATAVPMNPLYVEAFQGQTNPIYEPEIEMR